MNILEIKTLLLILFFTEITFNIILTFTILQIHPEIQDYKLYLNKYKDAINKIKETENKDNNFYRIGVDFELVYNSPSLLNYNGINH